MHRHLVTILAAVVAASATTFALAQAQGPHIEPNDPATVSNARVLEAVQKVRARTDEIRARAGEIRIRAEGIAARTKKIRDNLTALGGGDVCVITADGPECSDASDCVVSADGSSMFCPLPRGTSGRPARP